MEQAFAEDERLASFNGRLHEKYIEAISGYESLLDILATFLPNWMLEWHYVDERLKPTH